MQPTFSKAFIPGALLLAAPIFAFAAWSNAQPSRVAMPDAVVEGGAEAVRQSGAGVAGAKVQLWRLSAADRRFGGLSGLAVDRGELLALTDSGVTVRFVPPAQPSQRIVFHLHDLPAGPGNARRKRGRDSEALLADPTGRGWWVAFEGAHSLWRYDAEFTRALEVKWLEQDWPTNRGVEALVAGNRGEALALPEGGNEAVTAGTSDATRLDDGRLVLIVRRFGWRGFVNQVRIAGAADKPALRIKLPLGPLDNAEAVAAASLPNGGTRLWMLTDDNFRPWMRTLLVALDLPPGA